ncbi:MAG: hypothetical protein VXW20_02850 [Pseudomonadota bacterium]|nr:hypothetical protein [Pseudomonadota bacterium]
MHHYFQTEITLENLIRAARRQEFISYQRLNQAQGIADQDWSFASSLLIRHLDQLASKSHREGKPVFSFLAVARKELATGKHTKRRHRQIIRAFGDRAPAEKDIVAFIKKEQMRCFAWGMEKGWPTPEEKPVDAPRQPARNAEVQAARRHRS